MAGFDVQRVIAAYQAGKQIKDQKEQKIRESEDRDFELKLQKSQLQQQTIQQQMMKRKLEQENAAAVQGMPGPEFQIPGLSATPGGMRQDSAAPTPVQGPQQPGSVAELLQRARAGGAPTFTAGIPGQAEQTKELPHASMQISGVPELGVEGYTEQPQTMQELTRQARGQKVFDAQLKREENTFTVPDPTTGEPVTGPKELLDNIFTQSGSNARQLQQQGFTAAENEKKAKQDSEQAKLDRESRERVSLANRVAAGQRALQTGKQSRTVQQAISMANQFDQNAITKNYAVVREGADFARSLKGGTSSDDIGLLYAFAKAMDPGSVVREGEYATVQKYAQSWAQQFGFKVERIFSNSPFLAAEAKKNMIATIGSKEQAAKRSYENLRKEAGKKFQNIGETPEEWLANYDSGASGGQWEIVP